VRRRRFYFFVLAGCLAVFVSCSDDQETIPQDVPDPVVLAFSPTQGILGETVSISGENFSVLPGDNIVQFNGTPAVVKSATSNSLSVIVPDSATTGKLQITVVGKATTSIEDFIILSPSIEVIDPLIGSPGLEVRITGTNFSPTALSNRILIGAVDAAITSASASELKARIAPGTTIGKVTVQVGTQKYISEHVFQICDGVPELVISSVIITNTNPQMNELSFSCRLTNHGNVDLDLSKMVMQNYVSSDGSLDYDDSPAGGWILDSGGILSQGESYETTWSANVDYSVKKNLIVTASLKDGETMEECNTTNNVAVKAIQ
jgi:hypothetical protein